MKPRSEICCSTLFSNVESLATPFARESLRERCSSGESLRNGELLSYPFRMKSHSERCSSGESLRNREASSPSIMKSGRERCARGESSSSPYWRKLNEFRNSYRQPESTVISSEITTNAFTRASSRSRESLAVPLCFAFPHPYSNPPHISGSDCNNVSEAQPNFECPPSSSLPSSSIGLCHKASHNSQEDTNSAGHRGNSDNVSETAEQTTRQTCEPNPEQQEIEKHRKRRAKNNASAKKCRDKNRMKEIEKQRLVVELQAQVNNLRRRKINIAYKIAMME
ncbi:hypothetical protein NPIL_284331 [Nephila pilipes]|uniref:BZIP domain-containing protein n=1 Tax=Nephila pilipes TaxID=299642 RepID=A0A8X6TER9_NEPPI|nr:hypothetical protein NPIL_284331 [Nephila pilipes]